MILILLFFILICSFVLFVLSRHDFVLLRQNISLRHIFDKAGIILLFAVFISRAFFLINAKMYDFFIDPLRFLHVILYFGFNIFGLLISIALGVLFFFRKKKNFLRILDIYLLSFFPLTIFEAIFFLISGTLNFQIEVIYLLISLVLFIVLIKMHAGFKIKDGIVAFTILIFSSISYLAYSFMEKGLLIYSPIQIASILVIAVSLYCLVLVQIDFFKEK